MIFDPFYCRSLRRIKSKDLLKQIINSLDFLFSMRMLGFYFCGQKIESFTAFVHDLIFHIEPFVNEEIPLNGKSSKSILKISTPSAQISTLQSYSFF